MWGAKKNPEIFLNELYAGLIRFVKAFDTYDKAQFCIFSGDLNMFSLSVAG